MMLCMSRLFFLECFLIIYSSNLYRIKKEVINLYHIIYMGFLLIYFIYLQNAQIQRQQKPKKIDEQNE